MEMVENQYILNFEILNLGPTSPMSVQYGATSFLFARRSVGD